MNPILATVGVRSPSAGRWVVWVGVTGSAAPSGGRAPLAAACDMSSGPGLEGDGGGVENRW